jgi:hypothetical protein
LENTVSVARIILTTECALIHFKKENAGRNLIGGGMPGIM